MVREAFRIGYTISFTEIYTGLPSCDCNSAPQIAVGKGKERRRLESEAAGCPKEEMLWTHTHDVAEGHDTTTRLLSTATSVLLVHQYSSLTTTIISRQRTPAK